MWITKHAKAPDVGNGNRMGARVSNLQDCGITKSAGFETEILDLNVKAYNPHENDWQLMQKILDPRQLALVG